MTANWTTSLIAPVSMRHFTCCEHKCLLPSAKYTSRFGCRRCVGSWRRSTRVEDMKSPVDPLSTIIDVLCCLLIFPASFNNDGEDNELIYIGVGSIIEDWLFCFSTLWVFLFWFSVFCEDDGDEVLYILCADGDEDMWLASSVDASSSSIEHCLSPPAG